MGEGSVSGPSTLLDVGQVVGVAEGSLELTEIRVRGVVDSEELRYLEGRRLA